MFERRAIFCWPVYPLENFLNGATLKLLTFTVYNQKWKGLERNWRKRNLRHSTYNVPFGGPSVVVDADVALVDLRDLTKTPCVDGVLGVDVAPFIIIVCRIELPEYL